MGRKEADTKTTRPKKGDGGKAPPAGTPVCTTCRGSHPDVRGCPNGLAKQEPGFSTTLGSKCKWRVHGQYPCNGENHFPRHHRQLWVTENPGKTAPPTKGKGKGKGKYKGMTVRKRIAVLEDGTWLEDDDVDNIEYYEDEEEEAQAWPAGHEEPQDSPTAETSLPAGIPQSASQPRIGATFAPQSSISIAPEVANAETPDLARQRAMQWIASGHARPDRVGIGYPRISSITRVTFLFAITICETFVHLASDWRK